MYKLKLHRWRKHMEEVQGCPTNAQHLKTLGAPISKSHVHPPPNNNTEVEDNLKRFNNYVIHLYKNSKIDFNLTPAKLLASNPSLERRMNSIFRCRQKRGIRDHR